MRERGEGRGEERKVLGVRGELRGVRCEGCGEKGEV